MEAIWNYFYWQALGTNALDNVGHVLRLGSIRGCITYYDNPNDETGGCNQFLARPSRG